MIILDLLVVLSLLAVIITKLFDVISTIRRVPASGESNPFAGPLMQRFGVRKVAWGVFVLVVLIVMLAGAIALTSKCYISKISCCLFAVLIAIVQTAVARTNCGHPNFISGCVARMHHWIKQR